MTSNNLDAQKIGRETFGCVRWAVPLWSGAWLGTLCLGFRGDMVRVWLFMIVGIGWGGVGAGAACVCVCALSSGGCPSAGVPRGARADFVVSRGCFLCISLQAPVDGQNLAPPGASAGGSRRSELSIWAFWSKPRGSITCRMLLVPFET